MTYQPSTRAQVITRRTYNRPLNAEGTEFETWEQTVDRVIGHQNWLWERAKKSKLSNKQENELQDLRQLMLDRKVSTSGRTLWLGGTDVAKNREASQFNCSFLHVETVYDVVDALWLLLQGCGVGFKPIVGTLNGFFKPIKHIETVRSSRKNKGDPNNTETWDADTKTWTIKVGDSAEAWAKSIGKLMAGKYPADKLVLDYSEIRPAGTRLAGYGWISSGCSQIASAYDKISKIMNKRAGSLLTRIDILDVINHLGTILSSRRSAEIAVFDYGGPEWKEFALAKKNYWEHGNEHRTQSNNSLLFWSKPSREQLEDIFKLMQEAGGSEPGLINAETATKRAPWFKGSNPCVIGETQILTDRGYIPIIETVGKLTNVWNGKEWSEVIPFSTGVNPLMRVQLSDGTNLSCTPYHKWILSDGSRVETKELCDGDKLAKFQMPTIIEGETYLVDAYSQGFYSGDGNTGMTKSFLYSPKYCVKDRLIGKVYTSKNSNRCVWNHGVMLSKTFVPIYGSQEYCLNWLAGVLDSDGNLMRNPNSTALCLNANDKQFLLNIRLMLTRLGVQAKVVDMYEEGHKMMPDGRGGMKEYYCEKTHRLLINATDVKHLVEIGVKFSRIIFDDIAPNRDARRFVTVINVEDLQREEETYCFTEPKNNTGTFNGIVTGQCVEILLPNKGFCNLMEVDLNKFHGDTSGLHEALKLAARANYRQTCVDFRDGILQESWHLNNEFLRLCGVGLTGIATRPDLSDYDFSEMERVTTFAAYSMADELGLQRPKNVTCVKPSGSLSKIMDTSEGVHKPLGKYIFNNVSFSKYDPMISKLSNANYNIFDHPFDKTSVIVTFPVKWDSVEFDIVDGIEVNLDSAIKQLEKYKLVQNSWCHQNVSNTISYSPEEIPEIIDWMLDNWESYIGVSFLYRADPTKTAADLGYQYLPQEVVNKEKYDDYIKRLKEVVLDKISGFDEIEHDACATGACPIK